MKKFLVLLSFLWCSCYSHGQLFAPRNVALDWIEKAVTPALFIFNQSYQIRDKKTGELYGRYGHQEFGGLSSLGIQISQGIILTDKALTPWIYDQNFKKYKDKYEPVLFKSTYKRLDSTTETPLELSNVSEITLQDSILHEFSLTEFHNEGLVIDTVAGRKEGWVVIITNDSIRNNSARYSCQIIKKEFEIKPEVSKFEVDVLHSSNSVVGGLYLVPSVSKMGVLEFRLGGVLVNKNTKWEIICPFADVKTRITAQPADKDKLLGEDKELTPIEGQKIDIKKRKKKNKK